MALTHTVYCHSCTHIHTSIPLTIMFGQCSVCLETPATDPILTLCGHIFCWPCILQWSKQKLRCPTCRRAMTLSTVIPIYTGAGAVEDESEDAAPAGIPPRPQPPHLVLYSPTASRSSSPTLSSTSGSMLLDPQFAMDMSPPPNMDDDSVGMMDMDMTLSPSLLSPLHRRHAAVSPPSSPPPLRRSPELPITRPQPVPITRPRERAEPRTPTPPQIMNLFASFSTNARLPSPAAFQTFLGMFRPRGAFGSGSVELQLDGTTSWSGRIQPNSPMDTTEEGEREESQEGHAITAPAMDSPRRSGRSRRPTDRF